MKKRLLAVLLVISLSMGIMPEANYAKSISTENAESASESIEEATAGQSVSENMSDESVTYTYGTGLAQQQLQTVEITEEDACGAIDATGVRAASKYDKYASNYYYNFMTGEERDFYDRLDYLCYTYLTTQQDVEGIIYKETQCSEWISGGELSLDDMEEIFTIFRYSNPQYYFLDYFPAPGEDGSTYYLALSIYPAFISGSARSAATASLMESVGSMVAEIQKKSGVLEQEKEAHDLLINKLSYDPYYQTAIDNGTFTQYEKTAYTQSCYSAFCGDAETTVCAGYALAFEMLCNAVGIDCIVDLSEVHAWNIVRLNGTWYNVDCTWDDPTTSDGSDVLWYLFFNRSNAQLEDMDQKSAHVEEDYLFVYSPICYEDSGATTDSWGTIKEAEGTVATPTIAISQDDEVATLTISSNQNTATIYYTLDGTTPSVSATKSYAYRNSVEVSPDVTVKAVAVSSGYNDSTIVSQSPSSYTVSFNSQGGTAVTSRRIATGEVATKPTNPTRTGYTFGGWYKEASCKTAWNFTTDKVTSNVTLYAKWTPVTYKITYTLNSGKQSKSNPATYTVAASTITLVSPTRKNYTFGGWYKDSKFKTKVTKISKGSTGNLNLYAKWTKVSVSKAKISSVKNQSGKKMAVAVKKISGAAGYQIRYSTNSKLKSAKTVVTKTTSATIKSLKKNKTYYVQVRAYKLDSAGNKIYGSWSSTSSVKIKK